MEESNEIGPIRPRHIREAFRRLRHEGSIPYIKQKLSFKR